MFGVRRNAPVEICPIQGIERYMEVTRDKEVLFPLLALRGDLIV